MRDSVIAELLCDVWQVLPLDVVTVLAARFRGGVIEEVDVPLGDFLALAHTTHMRGDRWSILVNTHLLRRMSRDDVRFVLAHELAHVFLGHARNKAENVAEMARDEHTADMQAIAWGFRPASRLLLSEPKMAYSSH